MNILKDHFFKAIAKFIDKEQSNLPYSADDIKKLIQIRVALEYFSTKLSKGEYPNTDVHIGHTFGPFGFKVK